MAFRVDRMVGCILIAMCAACAPQQGEQSRAASDEWRLQNIEARFLEFQESQKEREAQLQTRVQDLDGQLSAVRQELNDTKTKAGELQAETAALKEALRARLVAAGEAPLADVPKAAPKPVPAASATAKAAPEKMTASAKKAAPQKKVAEKAAPKAAEPEAMAPAPAPASAPVPAMAAAPAAEKPSVADTAMVGDASGGPEKLYEEGLTLVRAGDVEKGRKLLDQFIGDNPNHALVPNALYWMGETYYHEKRYAQAVLTFKEVVRRFPKHDKAAASMLKTGFSYEQLGDKSNARFYLQTLVEDYPSSSPAEMARKRLASL
ncbi:tol-pal system protein YbgF [Desulfovibrio subterraneus]|uniref:tol-pal system protein YbgF n=1 Tax=Desulfovibrio subterraneus TaxID=2718620 RepID=UPI0022B8875E|nr:tol-pal system protein YbgF [Desulfovibrio subterraneus]WBF67782.1 tol-pal system protein YbgF [Desulfovibrio subterraneus]